MAIRVDPNNKTNSKEEAARSNRLGIRVAVGLFVPLLILTVLSGRNSWTLVKGSLSAFQDALDVEYVGILAPKKETYAPSSIAPQEFADGDSSNSNVIAPKQGRESWDFLVHVPKSGGSYAMVALGRLLFQSTFWKELDRSQRFRACNIGAAKLKKRMKSYKDIVCSLYMTEQFDHLSQNRTWISPARKTYIILRNPVEHTISQYFHCTESREHRKKELMPSLDTWLETYYNISTGKSLYNITTGKKEYDNRTGNSLEIERKDLFGRYVPMVFSLFNCYNPIDFQSVWAGAINKRGMFLLENATFSDQVDFFRERYTIMGDNAQMDKTVCAIFIHYTGWIPPKCDCTEQTTTTLNATNEEGNETQKKPSADHGVQHHGSSFNRSLRHDEFIQEIRRNDLKLYKVSKAVFEIQVQELEAKHDFKLCDSYAF